MTIQFKEQTKIGKILSRSKMIFYEFFEKWYFYSFKLAVYNSMWWIGNYCHPLVKLQFLAKHKMTTYMDNLLEMSVLPPPPPRYTRALCQPTTTSLTTLSSDCNPTNNTFTIHKSNLQRIVSSNDYKIWIFWWQGEESMPNLVRGCFQQVRNNNNNTILITKENIRQYSDIPDYIFCRVDQGEISLTHLSDILRVSLLAKYGGIWLDSTCWISGSIPEVVKRMKLISPNTKNQPELPFWSDSRWCGWCSGTNVVQNPLFVFTRDVFYTFYKTRSCIPFYLFIDYVYDYAYRKIPEVKAMIDEMPENNISRNKLHFLLNNLWNEQEYDKLCKDNWVFKLSYKSVWDQKTITGEDTYYGKLISFE